MSADLEAHEQRDDRSESNSPERTNTRKRKRGPPPPQRDAAADDETDSAIDAFAESKTKGPSSDLPDPPHPTGGLEAQPTNVRRSGRKRKRAITESVDVDAALIKDAAASTTAAAAAAAAEKTKRSSWNTSQQETRFTLPDDAEDLRPLDRSNLFRAFCDDVKAYERRIQSQRAVRPRLDHLLGKGRELQAASKRCRGDERRAGIEFMLSKLDETQDWRRSRMQRDVHEAMIEAAVLIIYPREEYMMHKKRILHELNVKDANGNPGTQPRQMVGLTCPRRYGKTIGTAQGGALLALAIPNFTLAIFSPGRRQSTMLLHAVHSFICWMGARHAIVRFNNEELWIQGPNGPTDIRKIYSYPSKPETGLTVCVCSLSLSLSLSDLGLSSDESSTEPPPLPLR